MIIPIVNDNAHSQGRPIPPRVPGSAGAWHVDHGHDHWLLFRPHLVEIQSRRPTSSGAHPRTWLRTRCIPRCRPRSRDSRGYHKQSVSGSRFAKSVVGGFDSLQSPPNPVRGPIWSPVRLSSIHLDCCAGIKSPLVLGRDPDVESAVELVQTMPACLSDIA